MLKKCKQIVKKYWRPVAIFLVAFLTYKAFAADVARLKIEHATEGDAPSMFIFGNVLGNFGVRMACLLVMAMASWHIFLLALGRKKDVPSSGATQQ